MRRKIDLGLLEDDPPVPGDWVLIHVGFAMSKISEEEALDQMRMLTHARRAARPPWRRSRGYGLERRALRRNRRHEIRR